jgi:hypothetical protein
MNPQSEESVVNGHAGDNGGQSEFGYDAPETPTEPAGKRGRKPGSKNRVREVPAAPAEGAEGFPFGANAVPAEPMAPTPPVPPAKPPEPPTTANGAGDGAPNPFDPARYRRAPKQVVPLVKRTITTCPVRQPIEGHFVRVHPDPLMRIEVGCIQMVPDDGSGKGFGKETYLIDAALDLDENGEPLSELPYDKTYRRVLLVTAISRGGGVFLWPVNVPKGVWGRDWYLSRLDLVKAAETTWIKPKLSDTGVGYDYDAPVGQLPEPRWPEGLDLGGLLLKAFRDRFINSLDHPVARALRGEV